MTQFHPFRFLKFEKSAKKILKESEKEKKIFYKRMEKSANDDSLSFDIYIPKNRTVYKGIIFNPPTGDDEENNFITLELDEVNENLPDKLTNGNAFLEAELSSQPCIIKDNKIKIYKQDLENLCNLTSQPLLENSWKTTADETTIVCPYCHGYYCTTKSKPTAIVCPYCYKTEAEAKKEAAKYSYYDGWH